MSGEAFLVGANWSSKDGKRNVVIEAELNQGRERTFMIRNLVTGRVGRIELSGLARKFRFAGYDPAHQKPSTGESNAL